MADTNDPRLLRLRVELYTAGQLLKGEDLEYFKELIGEISQLLDIERAATVPPAPTMAPGVAQLIAIAERQQATMDEQNRLLDRIAVAIEDANQTGWGG